MKPYNFEKKVIDKILNLIKKHQAYLTRKENLPQLAKLGYIYGVLYYVGRICYGYEGILKSNLKSKNSKNSNSSDLDTEGICEDNPKYKIEMCCPETEQIENLIYDAWGMHDTTGENQPSWDEFINIVMWGKTLSESEQLEIKPNKDFDEFVSLFTNKEYKYNSSFPDRKEVANYLLCVYGTGYGYNKETGYIFKEASGADQDISLYGDWQNAKFRKDIHDAVDKVLWTAEVINAVKESYNYVQKIIEENYNKRNKEFKEFSKEWTTEQIEKFERLFKSLDKLDILPNEESEEDNEDNYKPYYPISENYSIISLLNEKAHPSYILAAKEICEEILAHKEKESRENVKFAKKFLSRKNIKNFKTK